MDQNIKQVTDTINVVKQKNGVATVIEWNGKRYTLQHENQYKR